MRSFLLAGFLIIVSHGGVHAVYKMGDKKPVAAKKSAPHKKAASTPIDETPVLNNLSRKYGVSLEHLEYFRGLNFGYEELVSALVVSKESQVEVGKILSLRTDGQTWNQIADTYAVDLKPLHDEVTNVLNPIRKVLPKERIQERPVKRP